MEKRYPLTAAQKMHDSWIRQYRTQQVSGLSIVAALQTEFDFDILEKCIREETKRYGCMRVRFTRTGKTGKTQQYIISKDEREIPIKDLTGMSLQEADNVMQNWAYETFDGDDIPMCEVYMVKLPENYNGFFVHMDHRLIDSCAVMVMTGDILKLYTHYRYGGEYPDELSDYEMQLKADLEKAGNTRRFARDKKFWDEQLDMYGEPLYSDIQGPQVLDEARKRHGDAQLRSADIERKELFVQVKDYKLEPEAAGILMRFCEDNRISMTNLLLLGIRTYLSKQNGGQQDISVQNFISRRTTKDEWTSGGSRTIMFPCRTVIAPETDFIDAANIVQNVQNHIYMHSNYDPAYIYDEIRKRYNTPENTTYESCYLTYQPMSAKIDNKYLAGIPVHARWFANGAATKKMYLTVTHTDDGGMNFSYHYQTVQLGEKDVELMHYYLCRILFRGAEDKNRTIGEIMAMV